MVYGLFPQTKKYTTPPSNIMVGIDMNKVGCYFILVIKSVCKLLYRLVLSATLLNTMFLVVLSCEEKEFEDTIEGYGAA